MRFQFHWAVLVLSLAVLIAADADDSTKETPSGKSFYIYLFKWERNLFVVKLVAKMGWQT